jgi:hypothetical protein
MVLGFPILNLHYQVKLQLMFRLNWAVTILLCYIDICQYINDFSFFPFLPDPYIFPNMSFSVLKVSGGVGWWVPTHYHVKIKLILRLSLAVTIICYNYISQYINVYFYLLLAVMSSSRSDVVTPFGLPSVSPLILLFYKINQ